MLTDANAATVLAHGLLPAVLTDTCAAAKLTVILLPAVLTHASTHARLALPFPPPMLTDSGSSTGLTAMPRRAMLTNICIHTCPAILLLRTVLACSWLATLRTEALQLTVLANSRPRQ